MSVRARLESVSSAIGVYCQDNLNYVGSATDKWKVFRGDGDFIQKITNLQRGLIIFCNTYRGTSQLLSLANVLESTYLSDFFGFIPMINEWLKPINAKSVHKNALLDVLAHVYTESLNVNVDEYAQVFDESRKVIQPILEQFIHDLNDMDQGRKFGYATSAKFLAALQLRLNANNLFRDSKIDIVKEIGEVPLNTVSWGQWTTNTAFHVVTGACVVHYLRVWGLVDTAKWAASIGQVPVLSLVNKIDFDYGFKCVLLFAFASAMVESSRKFLTAIFVPEDKSIGPQEAYQARWDAVAYAAKSACFATGVFGVYADNLYVAALSLIAAEAIGCLNIARRPNADMFDKPAVETMPSLITRMKEAAIGLLNPITQQKYVLLVTEKIANIARFVFEQLNDLIDYEKDGFDKLYKSLRPKLSLLNHALIYWGYAQHKVFNKCKETVMWHNDLILATKVFFSIPNWIVLNPKKSKEEEKNVYDVRCPLYKWSRSQERFKLVLNDSEKWSKTLQDIAALFETTYFMRKYKIYNFDYFVAQGAKIGGYVKNVPVLKHISTTPKYIPAMGATVIEMVAQGYNRIVKGDVEQTNWENCAKFACNFGKATLIVLDWGDVWEFNVIESLTGDAGLIRYAITMWKLRQKFEPPVASALTGLEQV